MDAEPFNPTLFRSRCFSWDGEKAHFAQIISCALAERPNIDRTLADEFACAPATIRRWASGLSFPFPPIARHVLLFLVRELAPLAPPKSPDRAKIDA